MRRDSMKIYVAWKNMKSRCKRPRLEHGESHYSKITYCEEWERFEPFYEWAMNNGYNKSLKLDRIDNEKGYSPDNCRFITNKENSNNRSDNKLITFNGKTQTISQWAEELGIKYSTLTSRLNKLKWSEEKALTAPKWYGVENPSKKLKRNELGRFVKDEQSTLGHQKAHGII